MFVNLLNYKNFNKHKVRIFCSFFFVLSLVFSRFFADLFVVLCSLGLIFLIIKNNLKVNSRILTYFFIFYVYLVFCSLFSAVPIQSLSSSLPYIRFILFIFFISFFLDRVTLKVILYSFLFIYFLLLIDGIFQIKTGYNFIGFPLEESGRVSSFFGRHLILGSFISKTFPILVFLIFYLNIKYKFYFYFATIIFSTILVYISRERSSFFVYIVCLFFSTFLIERKYFFKVIFIVFLQCLFVLFLNQSPLQRIYAHTKSQLFNKDESFAIFSNRHELHYITAFRIFKDSPIIGSGPNSFRYLCDKKSYSVNDLLLHNLKYEELNKLYENGCNTHPHHLYLQLLSETGIVGFVFMLIFYLFICKSLLFCLFKYITNGVIFNEIIIFGYYFSVLFPLLPSGNFFNNYYSILLYLPLTLIILCQRK
jgi:O-antigen ligase